MAWQVKCEREISGEYLRAGDTYTVEIGRTPKSDVHFRNAKTGGGTFMRPWFYNEAPRVGALVIL